MAQLKIKKILCAVDFSDESKKALEFSLSLSSQLPECELVVLSVLKPIPTPIGDFTGASEALIDDDQDNLKTVGEKLKNFVQNSRGDCTSKIVDMVVLGNPVDEIIRKINDEKPDLVVMGNKKHGFKRGIFTGSVSARVSANSLVSVLVVR